MRKITEKELKQILELHKKWLTQEEGGERADLRETDLTEADLSYANLTRVDLINANLREVNLSYADLSGANLTGADLTEADLTEAKLSKTILTDVKYDHTTKFFALQCSEEGAFIAYKKAREYIVKLEVPSDAKRSSATSRECRVSKASVISITSIDGKQEIEEVASEYDSNFIYKVGETVEIFDFDEDRWKECSTGIHCFITRQEAVLYE